MTPKELWLVEAPPPLDLIEKFRRDIEGLLTDLQELERRAPCAAADEAQLKELSSRIFEDFATDGLLDRTPVEPAQLQVIRKQILTLPMVREIMRDWRERGTAGRPAYVGLPDRLTCQRDLPSLEFKLGEMLTHLPASKRDAPQERRVRRSPLRSPASERAQALSEADEQRYLRIGRVEIESHDNGELWTRHRREEKRSRPDITKSIFRHSINRIRVHHQLPSSQQLREKKLRQKKSDQRLVTKYGQE